MKVLLVDDEPDLLSLLKGFFKNRGDNVETAVNGEQAWQMIQASSASAPFDVLFTDHRMPVMNGITLVKKLRHHGFTLPVVLISGDNEAKKDDQMGKELVALLSKPTRLDELEQVIAKVDALLSNQ